MGLIIRRNALRVLKERIDYGLREVLRVLKPGGRIILRGWICGIGRKPL